MLSMRRCKVSTIEREFRRLAQLRREGMPLDQARRRCGIGPKQIDARVAKMRDEINRLTTDVDLFTKP